MSNNILTIGLATYDDYDGVFFTIQSIRMYHLNKQLQDRVEFIVLDNNPNSAHGQQCKKFLETAVPNSKYIPYTDKVSSFNKYEINNYATGKYVLIMDCHVLLANNAIKLLLDYFEKNPDCKNLIQGPLLYDKLDEVATHFKPHWGSDMYGAWALNKEAFNKGEPFEIEMQGMGLFAYEKNNWPGINENFKGFGAEEGYIAEKFRQNGGKNICLPQLQWVHRFGRPNGVKFPLVLEDRVWNYLLGWIELTGDINHPMIQSIVDYFSTRIPKDKVWKILNRILEEFEVPK